MRFLFFSKGGREIPSSRYRAYYLAEALNELGHDATVMPVAVHSFADFARYLRMLLSARTNDVIFLQRTIYSRAFVIAAAIAWLMGRRFIFDIDDAVFAPPAKRVEFIGALATLITCGSDPVLAWARMRRRRAVYLFNGLPLNVYTPREREPDGVPVIGWIGGGPAHLENLALVPPILHALIRDKVAFRFKLIGACGDERVYQLFSSLPPGYVEMIDTLNWADPSEAVREVKTFSVGIMPLAETGWNQAKHFKALEYMACGVPVVASAAATLMHILSSNQVGFIARSEEEWVRALKRLLQDAERRKEEGRKGRVVIERSYSSTVMAQTLLAAIANAGSDISETAGTL